MLTAILRAFALTGLLTAGAPAPPAPDGAGIAFEFVMTIGREGVGEGEFKYIEDFAFSREGHLLATDAAHAYVQVFNRQSGAFITRFGGKGRQSHHLEKPEGVAVAPDGSIYIGDYNTGYVKRYDADHRWRQTFSSYGSAMGQTMMSEFMDIWNGRLYVPDVGNHRVNVFSLEGEPLFHFGGHGQAVGAFDTPESAKVNSRGEVFVADLRNDRIQVFDFDGGGGGGGGAGNRCSPSEPRGEGAASLAPRPASRSTVTATSTSPKSATRGSRFSIAPACRSPIGVAPARPKASSPIRTASSSMPKAGGSTSPIPAITAFRCSAGSTIGAARPEAQPVAAGHAPTVRRKRLRQTLTAAFLLLAMLGGACGAVGLIYVTRINATVTVFADVTSPMLATMMRLVEDSLRSRMAFANVWRSERADVAQLRAQLERFHAETIEKTTQLRGQFANAGVSVQLRRTEQLERDLVSSIDQAIVSYEALQTAKREVDASAEAFAKIFATAEGELQTLIASAEADVAILEEETKVKVQTGTADIADLGLAVSQFFNQTYQMLEKSRWLSRSLQQMEDTATAIALHDDPQDVEGETTKIVATFATVDNLLALMAGRMSDPGRRQHHQALADAFGQLRETMLGRKGMLANARAVVAARRAVAEQATRAGQLEAAYFDLLENVRNVVVRINRRAQHQAEHTIADARLGVAASLGLVLLVAVVLATWLSRRIARPLSQLTQHAVAVGETGKLEPMPGAPLVGAEDEIAALAQAFNRMINELAEARSQLIAQSEEEVRVQYERLNAALTNMPQGLAMFDHEQRLVVCNDRFIELYAISRQLAATGTPYRSLLEAALRNCDPSYLAENGGTIEALVENAEATFNARRYTVRELQQDRTVAVRHTPMANGGAVTTHEDITERRRAEAKIAHMAMHDMLTDLANRTAFRDSLSDALTRVHRGEEMAVLYFDLDHFKHVNDSLGHPVGDALLRAVAARLKGCVRETDTVARLGGDEFAIVQVSLQQPRGAAELAARLVAEIGRPYEIDGQTVVIGASVGIALAPADGTDADTLLRNADMALYRSKSEGRGTYSFFEPAMDAKMQARRALELELRRANALDEFELYYQPLVNTTSGRVMGCEALLRWNHPQRGIIPPREFMPVAEEIGLLAELGSWILQEACDAARGWPPELKISVNLSPTQFAGGRLLGDVKRALAQSGLDPRRLELEITEDLLVRDPDSIIAALYELRTIGVRVAMDDFGTGHSSLGYLRRFPFDKIKIDRSFVHEMSGRRDAVAVVRAVNGLATALGIETVAEGVETDEQLANARAEGCSAVQGEFFSAPVPLAEVDALFGRTLEPYQHRNRRDAA